MFVVSIVSIVVDVSIVLIVFVVSIVLIVVDVVDVIGIFGKYIKLGILLVVNNALDVVLIDVEVLDKKNKTTKIKY